MFLIEHDKRGKDFAMPLTYSPKDKFYIPENIYVIGMMNTADRSLQRRYRFIKRKN
jgi:5-methylcytosine-specific restriction enzyme B